MRRPVKQRRVLKIVAPTIAAFTAPGLNSAAISKAAFIFGRNFILRLDLHPMASLQSHELSQSPNV